MEICVGVLFLCSLGESLTGWVNILRIGIAVASIGLMFVMGVWWIWIRIRLHSSARECGYLLCPHCLYPLVGLPNNHNCPECGRPFDLTKVETNWRWYLLR